MTEEDQRYPLSWPEQWSRTPAAMRTYSRFDYQRTMPQAFEFLRHEMVQLIDGGGWTMSSNVRRGQHGGPITVMAKVSDPGVAVYFKIKDKPVSLACDKWLRVEDNCYAIAKHIEALRGQERWGVGTIEQAFRGYMALPGVGQTSGINWWQVLGVPINSDPDRVRDAFRTLAKKHHPDKGGDREHWERINTAIQLFDAQIRNGHTT